MLWRRFLVSSDRTLADLHVVLQIGFDWTDFHLIPTRKKDYVLSRLGGLACHDPRKITHFRINERFSYDYDFCSITTSRNCRLGRVAHAASLRRRKVNRRIRQHAGSSTSGGNLFSYYAAL